MATKNVPKDISNAVLILKCKKLMLNGCNGFLRESPVG